MKVKFGELKEGTRFFDEYSGDFWIKLEGNWAKWDDSGCESDLKESDWFNDDEFVIIN